MKCHDSYVKKSCWPFCSTEWYSHFSKLVIILGYEFVVTLLLLGEEVVE